MTSLGWAKRDWEGPGREAPRGSSRARASPWRAHRPVGGGADVRREDDGVELREREVPAAPRRARRAPRRPGGRVRSASSSAARLDELAARGVDEERRRASCAARNAASTRPAVSGRTRQVEGEEVARGDDLVARGQLDAERAGDVLRRVRVVGDRPRHPSARARRATSRPIAPKPSRPTTLPSRPTPVMRSHAPSRARRSAYGIRRARAKSSPITSSATAALFAPGVLVTTMPRSRAASRSTAVDADAVARDHAQPARRLASTARSIGSTPAIQPSAVRGELGELGRPASPPSCRQSHLADRAGQRGAQLVVAARERARRDEDRPVRSRRPPPPPACRAAARARCRR